MQDLQKHHYDVNSYHCVSKFAYFVEHNIGYHPSKFQCPRMSGSNFMDGGWKRPPQCYNKIKKPSAYRVKGNIHVLSDSEMRCPGFFLNFFLFVSFRFSKCCQSSTNEITGKHSVRFQCNLVHEQTTLSPSSCSQIIGGPRATAGHRKYSGIYWKNFTGDHSFKVSVFSRHLLHHKAALLFITHTVHVCT